MVLSEMNRQWTGNRLIVNVFVDRICLVAAFEELNDVHIFIEGTTKQKGQ